MASMPELTVKLMHDMPSLKTVDPNTGAPINDDLDRRLAYFWVDERNLVSLLIGWSTGGKWYKPEIKNLPADAKFLGVNYCWERRAFLFLFQHLSFIKILPGETIYFGGKLEVEWREEERAVNPDSASGTHRQEIDNRREEAVWDRCAVAALKVMAQSQSNTEAVAPNAVVTERLRQRGWEV